MMGLSGPKLTDNPRWWWIPRPRDRPCEWRRCKRKSAGYLEGAGSIDALILSNGSQVKGGRWLCQRHAKEWLEMEHHFLK